MNPAPTTAPTSLSIRSDDPLVVEIKAEVAKADKKARETVTSFRKLGQLLIELKARVPHGSFMGEVEKLTGIPHRSATRYMGMVNQKPSRARLRNASADAYLRKCIDVRVAPENQNGHLAKLPAPTPAVSAPVTIDAEFVEPADDDPPPLVVDGTEETPQQETGWMIAAEFIDRLKGLSPTMERGGLCDMIDHCQKRLAELDKEAKQIA